MVLNLTVLFWVSGLLKKEVETEICLPIFQVSDQSKFFFSQFLRERLRNLQTQFSDHRIFVNIKEDGEVFIK